MVQKFTTALAIAFSATLVTATAIDRRIVGGEDAEEGQFPSTVRVYPMVNTRPDGSSDGFCGGTLVDSTTVLTAAHCFDSSSAKRCRDVPEACKGLAFNVRAGSLSRDTGGILAQAANLTVHPGYTGKSTIPDGLDTQYGVLLNDIAIIKLSTPIEENGSTIRYASLPESGSDPEANSKAMVAGWGLDEFGGRTPATLRHVVVPIIDRKNCGKELETIVCAGEKGKDACQSDSGGPLLEQETGKLIGIVSNGFQCATPIGGRYTRVASYIPFINENRGGSAGVQFPQDDNDGCDQGKAIPGPRGTVCIGPKGEIFGPPRGQQQQDCPPFPCGPWITWLYGYANHIMKTRTAAANSVVLKSKPAVVLFASLNVAWDSGFSLSPYLG
ncbi:Trypsin [Metarhizium anisopliae]